MLKYLNVYYYDLFYQLLTKKIEEQELNTLIKNNFIKICN